MGTYANRFGPHNPDETYVPHAFPEELVDLGEVQMNYVEVGDRSLPALLLIPGQTESWWGYEGALALLVEHFNAFAVDLRGQGRSTRTPGRYTLDNIGNDLVRFIDTVIRRPTIVSGLSSGGVLSAWLSAFAKPGQVVACCYEDPPLFASQTTPAVGHSIRHSIGPMFNLWATYLGPQWSVGDWEGMKQAAGELPGFLGMLAGGMPDEPSQILKEYDPEWGKAFWSGSVAASCDHAAMLAQVKVPVLLTHHFHMEQDGALMGAYSDVQAERIQTILAAAGVPCDYRVFAQMGHSMHGQDPQLFTDTLVDWVGSL